MKQYECPKCDCADLNYVRHSEFPTEDTMIHRWTCPECGLEGAAYFRLKFVGHDFEEDDDEDFEEFVNIIGEK
jgi:predicted nucleic-acid-binding Zn-ribbon protein